MRARKTKKFPGELLSKKGEKPNSSSSLQCHLTAEDKLVTYEGSRRSRFVMVKVPLMAEKGTDMPPGLWDTS